VKIFKVTTSENYLIIKSMDACFVQQASTDNAMKDELYLQTQ